jgi:hypothetical protein
MALNSIIGGYFNICQVFYIKYSGGETGNKIAKLLQES